jgi:nucleotide-binding universal stress UspA family protein
MLPKIETILYTTDLQHDASYVFRYALALARQHQAKIFAVHGMEPLPPFGQKLVEQYISHDTSEEKHRKARENVKAQLKMRMEKLCTKECNNAPSCENAVSSIQVVEGYPSQVIVDTANAISADLIVMGERYQNIVSKVVMGSTTRKVLHSADQPVLVVKIPKGYEEELNLF